MMRRVGQRLHGEIDVGRQALVQAHLCQAIPAPRLEGPQVSMRVTDGLLELVGAAVGQEDP
jgi:hypothetical protein